MKYHPFPPRTPLIKSFQATEVAETVLRQFEQDLLRGNSHSYPVIYTANATIDGDSACKTRVGDCLVAG